MLEVKNLTVQIENKQILKNLNLEVAAGEVHALMGPNGSGKSTLSKVIAGHPDIEEIEGQILFQGSNLLEISAEERALLGIFLSFQYPTEIPGLNNLDFLRAAYNSKRIKENKSEIDRTNFQELVRQKTEDLGFSDSQKFLTRDLNAGFSGGEKKRNELLQMSLLEPSLAILDEVDSGLDIDSLKIVSNGIKSLFQAEEKRALLLITHYQRLLDYLEPTHVHILYAGEIIKSGSKEIVEQLEKEGYEKFIQEHSDKHAKSKREKFL